MSPHPDTILADLKSKLGKRAHPNLDVVHSVCREVHNASGGNKDYSPTSVGRITQGRGGPSLNTLLAPGGKHFRTLIEAWASYSGVDTKRPDYSKREPAKDEIMDAIEDPVLRSLVGPKLAELRRLRAEVNLLKSRTVTTVDLRPRVADGGHNLDGPATIVPQLVQGPSSLVPAERAALMQLLDASWRKRAGLRAGANGELIADRPFRAGADVLPVGFLDALTKVLGDPAA